MGPTSSYDYLLVGAGLQNTLIALSVLHHRPRARIVMLERGERAGGNHTWCFHQDDAPPSAMPWLRALVEHEWPEYEVRFPSSARVVPHRYRCLTSARVDGVLRDVAERTERLELRFGAEATRMSAREVELDTGEVLRARVVIDARGPSTPTGSGAGFQKFLGLELRLRSPVAPLRPRLMDADVAQTDGFRFLYVLPFAPDRILVEDTCFSDSPALDADRLRAQVLAYVARQGWGADGAVCIEREEHGVLPMPFTCATSSFEPRLPLVAGYAGGWFHPATGYSFPAAVRLAEHVGSTPPDALFSSGWQALTAHHRDQAAFCTWLNRLLFCAVVPEQRWRVFERFYRLGEDTLRRFYALQLTRADMARILIGRPPAGLRLRGLWDAARHGVEASA